MHNTAAAAAVARTTSAAVLLICLFVFQMQIQYAIQTPVVSVQLHKHKISEYNDTKYIENIMRLAKSAEMRNYMRTDVDACDNFYRHACGNWPKINPADGIEFKETNFFQLLARGYNQKQLHVLLEGIRDTDNAAEVKIKEFFESCMNLSSGKQLRSYKYKLREIIEEFGLMPALYDNDDDATVEPTWQADNFDWLETIAKIEHRYGFDIILQLAIRPDFENKSENKLFIGQPTLELETKSMYNSEATKIYRLEYRNKIAKSLNYYLDMPLQRAENVSNNILNFEIQLSQGIMDKHLGNTFKSQTKLRTVAEMQAAYAPTIDFEKYLTISLGQTLNTTFYEYIMAYQENLVEVIQNTSKAELANYIGYQLIQSFFHKSDAKQKIRENACLDKTKVFFAKLLDNIIFRKYNNNATINDIESMWQNLKKTFKAELTSDKLHWMSLMTRKLAVEKLEAMKLQINSYDNDDLIAEYQALNISNNDYVENVKHILQLTAKQSIADLFKPAKPIEAPQLLSFSPAYINTENLIKIPILLLQPNYLWSDYYPNALKFGTLGFLVAHELTHGFDDMGRNFDMDGLERMWWDDNSTQAFNERKQCFKNQYKRYRYNGKYLPESELQAENIADNAGIQIAYNAYLNWLKKHIEEEPNIELREQRLQMESLPHMNYTNKQLFFLSYAQFWCNDIIEHLKDKVALINLHAPAEYRVIGSLANFNQFSQQFHCEKATTMNPTNKCYIYTGEG